MEYLSHLEKARKELEDFYLGVPDDSEDLSFDYLAQAQQRKAGPSTNIKKSGPLDPTAETNPRKQEQSTQFCRVSNDSNGGSFWNHRARGGNEPRASRGPHRYPHRINDAVSLGHVVPQASFPLQIVLVPRQTIWVSPQQCAVEKGSRAQHAVNNLCTRREGGGGFRSHAVESSMVYDEMSGMTRVGSMSRYPLRGEEGRRRPGIPHSNKCTICCDYIFVFRTRCLVVCGRAYCRQCVSIGMGEMTEGRKCIECLGRRFSQRYSSS
ncbi:hypothetical protein RHSIM_Rhsim13G0059500 [Rhododendron simsii]|uniref:Uncharacterized protein n=1 Tax=Rhododendron simsii TaxID=118357 RepID=A0A834G0G4_RHOSS|nr:hypothetical protein RHSIM_Rhsim13G0059500 [Rhododendron simsii]